MPKECIVSTRKQHEGPRFVPVKALIFHKMEGETVFPDDGRGPVSTYVTVNDILGGELTAGSPMTREQLISLCTTVMPGIVSDPVFLPEDVLIHQPVGEGVLAWWTRPQVKNLYFKKSTGIPSGAAPLPSLLFLVRDGGLELYALKSASRPAPDTVLYKPPFFNISGRTGICMGSARKYGAAIADRKKWEDSFYRSAFTAEGAPDLKGVKDPAAFWKDLIVSGKKRFPTKVLKRHGSLKVVLSGRNL